MIKNGPAGKEPARSKMSGGYIAVIDTETNWRDEVMSIGVAVADAASFCCAEKKYYIIDPAYRVGGIYSDVLNKCDVKAKTTSRGDALEDLKNYLREKNISKIFAYNGRFDLGHLPELADFEWYDIMRLAAYRQFNPAITDDLPCCKSGRLKTGYGVEPILRMLSGNKRYFEVHNAVADAADELRIIELLAHPLEDYEIARISHNH